MDDPRSRAITWSLGHDPEYIYAAEVDGARWVIRLGDFPDEPLYTLLVRGEVALEFDDWPPAWGRPDHPGG